MNRILAAFLAAAFLPSAVFAAEEKGNGAKLPSRNVFIRFFEYRDAGSPRLAEQSALEMKKLADGGHPLAMFLVATSSRDPEAPEVLRVNDALRESYIEKSRDKIEHSAKSRGNGLSWYLLALADEDDAKLAKAAKCGNRQAEVRQAQMKLIASASCKDSAKRNELEKEAIALLVSAGNFDSRSKKDLEDASPGALNLLGKCLERGIGKRNGAGRPVPDVRGALKAYRLAADLGHPDALHNLARMLFSGKGLKAPDPENAFKALREAAGYGHPDAMGSFGMLLVQGLKDRDGNVIAPANMKSAMYYLKEAAEAGSPVGAYGYGKALADEAGNAQQKAEAARWIDKAAAAGVVEAKFDAASILLDNPDATPAEELRAATYLKSAAEDGKIDAMELYSKCLAEGRGTTKSAEESTLWRMRARAARGDVSAAGWLKLKRLREKQLRDAGF